MRVEIGKLHHLRRAKLKLIGGSASTDGVLNPVGIRVPPPAHEYPLFTAAQECFLFPSSIHLDMWLYVLAIDSQNKFAPPGE